MLMRYGIDLRTGKFIDFIDDGVRKSVKVVDAEPEIAMRAS